MRFIAGLVAGVFLSAGAVGLYAQNERMMHPRIARAIHALQDAEDYMRHAPHDFGGHREDAIRASDDAIRQLQLALAYRAEHDHR